MGVPFPRQVKINSGEAVVFSYIVFKSRAHRDRVNAREKPPDFISGGPVSLHKLTPNAYTRRAAQTHAIFLYVFNYFPSLPGCQSHRNISR
jgi:hypothetical protein